MPRVNFSQVADPWEDVFHDTFDEIGLMLGGLVAIHHPTIDPEMDDFLWRFCRNLDAIRGRAFRRLNPKLRAKRPNVAPHPAIEEFLHPRVTFEEP